jgi:hypothetical protein
MTGKLISSLTAPEAVAKLVSRTSTIKLNADIGLVFPLFGPLREMEWAEGWSPEILYGSGAVSEFMVFVTKANSSDEEFFRWIVTQYKPDAHSIGYTVNATDRVWFINVECKGSGSQTLAAVSYTYIGFTEEARCRNQVALGKMFECNLLDWEEAINFYLRTGQKLIKA